MLKKTVPLLLHPHFTKITAVLLGYLLWASVAQHQSICQSYTVPICFYPTDQRIIQAPESVILKISGIRKEMFHLLAKNLAIHINVENFSDGEHEILLNSSNLFLPDTLHVVELIPSCIKFKIQKISSES